MSSEMTLQERIQNIPSEAFTQLREHAGASLEKVSKRYPNAAKWESGEKRPNWKTLENYCKALLSNSAYMYSWSDRTDERERYIWGGIFRTEDEPIKAERGDTRYLDLRKPDNPPAVSRTFIDYLFRVSLSQDEMVHMIVDNFGPTPFNASSIPSRQELEKLDTIQDMVNTLAEHRILVMAEIVIPMKHGDKEILAQTVLDPEEFHGFVIDPEDDNLGPAIGLNLWAPDNVKNLMHAVDLVRERKTAVYHIDPDACGIPKKQVEIRREQYLRFRDGKVKIKKNSQDVMFLQNGNSGFEPDPDQVVTPMSPIFLLWLNMMTQEGKIMYRDAWNHLDRWRCFNALVKDAERIHNESREEKL